MNPLYQSLSYTRMIAISLRYRAQRASNQLNVMACHEPERNLYLPLTLSEWFMVDLSGIEPLTSSLRTKRSPSWATGPVPLTKLSFLDTSSFGYRVNPNLRSNFNYTILYLETSTILYGNLSRNDSKDFLIYKLPVGRFHNKPKTASL